MINKSLFAALLLIGMSLLASEHGGGHKDSNSIPLETIGWQAANLGILLVAIFYFAKKAVIDMFAKRKADFIEQSEKTRALLKQAENELMEIKSKLSTLESGEAKALENAKHEASLLKANLIKDSEAQATKIKNDAQAAIQNELVKAKQEINQLILTEAIASAKDHLSGSSATNKKLIESQFLSQVERAQSSGAGL